MDETEEKQLDSRCGYAAIVGRPNAGKSTLLNRIVGKKISIVTHKPQTTRNRILAVLTRDNAQAIFFDTPGMLQPRDALGRYMLDAAHGAIANADLTVFLIDAGEPRRPPGLTGRETEIAERLARTPKPILVLINKVDLISDKARLLPLMEAAAAIEGACEVIPISAKNGDGVELFVDKLIERLPEGPKLYPDDILSEQAERFFVAEMVREAVTELTHREVPYRSAVVIDSFVEETRRAVIHATIHVEKASQRGILVGSQGSMIKRIGKKARLAATEFLGCPVELRLHVDVSPGWTRNPKGLKKLGYE
jgi:GTP-binding protein Era